MKKRGRSPKAAKLGVEAVVVQVNESKGAKQAMEAVGEFNKFMAVKQEREAIGEVNDSKAVKQTLEAVGEVNGSVGGSKTNRFRGVRMRHSGRFSAEFRTPPTPGKKHRRYLGTFNSAEEAARAYDLAAVSRLGSKAKTNFPLPPNSSYPQDNSQDPNPNFNPQPCLQDQHQILRPHMPDVSSFSAVKSISEHKPQLEQLNFLQKMRSATPKAQNQSFMAQSSVPEPTTIILEHQKSLHDEHHKKKKSKQYSLPEMASQHKLASVEVRPDAGVVGAWAEVPSIWTLGHVDHLETSGANIMHSSDHYCPNWSLKINDRACDAHVVTELNEGSVLPRDKILALNLPDEILHEQLQAGLANVHCVEMEVLRRFKESNVRLQRISKERDGLALHNDALVTNTTMLGEHTKEQETKLRKLEAELELCKSELSQSKTELEQKEIEMEIELGAAEHGMAEIEARHQAVLNEVEAKHKAALSEAAEMAVKDFKRSKACEDDLVVLIAPAYGMGFTEALDLAKSSGASIDLSQEAFARAYKPGLRDELMRRVALFKEGKVLSEFYQIDGQAVPERSGPSADETAKY